MSATRTTPKEMRSLVLLLDAALNDEGMPEQDRREALEDLRATAQDLMEETSQEEVPATPPVGTAFRWEVVRTGESTMAVVTGRLTIPGTPSAVAVRNRLCAACTAWRRSSPEGRRAWDSSAEDFNVGDLAHELDDPADPTLIAALRQECLVDLRIQLHTAGPHQACPHVWHYDTVLMDPNG